MKVLFILVFLILPNISYSLENSDPIELIECWHWGKERISDHAANFNGRNISSLNNGISYQSLLQKEQFMSFYEEELANIIPKSNWRRILDTNWPNGFEDSSSEERVDRLNRCRVIFQTLLNDLKEDGKMRAATIQW